MGDVFTPTRYKLTVEDYHKLGEVGILNEDSRVELIDGELIEMAPIGGPHMWAVNKLNYLLVTGAGQTAVVSVQNPVMLPPHSEPQPDFALLKRPGNSRNVPTPQDVLLVVEVADTTLAYDRGRKLQIYAKAGIVEVWIVNVEGRSIETYRQPSQSGYSLKKIYSTGESISPERLPQVMIQVQEVFD